MSVIYLVDPRVVILAKSPAQSDVSHQRQRLEKEGQLEPLEVAPPMEKRGKLHYRLRSDWPYAEAQVYAARQLDWPTILVTY